MRSSDSSERAASVLSAWWRPWRRTGASRAAADQLAHAAAFRATAVPWALVEQLHGTTATARRLSRSWRIVADRGDSFRRRAASQLPAAASSCGQRALSQKPVPASRTGPRAHQLYGDATRGALLAERCQRWPSRSRCGRRPHRRSASECGECGARRSGAPAVNSKRGGRGALVTEYPRSTYRRLRSAAHRRSRERATSGSARTSTGASRRAPSHALL